VLNPTPIIPGPTTQGPSIETRIDPPKVDPGSPTGIQSRIDSSEAPLVRPDPVYPRTAQTRGIEGWVEPKFTISGSGAVTDVTVVDADPKGMFDAAASKAVQSWKYAPRVREGRAVEQRGVRVVLRFDLD
jgi:protein TonB